MYEIILYPGRIWINALIFRKGPHRNCRQGLGMWTNMGYNIWRCFRGEQTSKQTDRQTDRQTDKQTDRQTDKQTLTNIKKQTDRQTNKQTNKQTKKHYLTLTNRQTDRQTDRQTLTSRIMFSGESSNKCD